MRLRNVAAAAAAAVVTLAGCGTTADDAAPGTATRAPGGHFPVTVNGVTVDDEPARIISLAPTATEMLFAIGAGNQVVAVDEYSNFPETAPTSELSGFNPNIEAVAGYDPDLVVLSSFGDSLVPQLDALSIPAFVTADDPADLDDVYQQILDLGELTGRTDEAPALVERMTSEIAKTTAEAPERETPLTYYIEIDDTYWTYTPNSIIGSLFRQAGLENIAEDESTAATQLSAEAIIDANPDVIFLINTDFGVTAETVAQRPGWAGIAAVRAGNIVELDPDMASRWGPRLPDLLAHVVAATANVP